MERRLAAILAADLVGYSAMVCDDEEGTLSALKSLRLDVLEPLIAEHRGRIVKLTGDGFLVEFSSALDAARCAFAWQERMSAHKDFLFRIGLNLGDIVVDGEDILGDGVNVAARLEGLAPPGGVCLSGIVRDQIRGKVDAVLTPRGPQRLKNMPEPVEVWQSTVNAAGPDDQRLGGGLAEGADDDRPSIVVLPFKNASDDPDQAYFADGITEDVTSELCRFTDLLVIAAGALTRDEDAGWDTRDISQKFGTRFVLEGSVRRAGSRVRVSVSLIEGRGGHRIWSDQYQGDLADTFEMQDAITRQVVGKLEPEIAKAQLLQARREGLTFDKAYDLAWLGRTQYVDALKLGDRERLEAAIETTRQAIDRNPSCLTAYVTLCACCAMRHLFAWTDDPSGNRALAERTAHDLFVRSGGDYLGFFARGYVNETFGRFDEAIADLERAHNLNPNDAWVLVILARAKSASGNGAEARHLAERALQLSPNDVWIGSAYLALAMAAFLDADYPALRLHAERAVQDNPGAPIRRSLLIACAGEMQDRALAERHLQDLQASSPEFIDTLRRGSNRIFRDDTVMERYIASVEAGVRLANAT